MYMSYYHVEYQIMKPLQNCKPLLYMKEVLLANAHVTATLGPSLTKIVFETTCQGQRLSSFLTMYQIKRKKY